MYHENHWQDIWVRILRMSHYYQQDTYCLCPIYPSFSFTVVRTWAGNISIHKYLNFSNQFLPLINNTI